MPCLKNIAEVINGSEQLQKMVPLNVDQSLYEVDTIDEKKCVDKCHVIAALRRNIKDIKSGHVISHFLITMNSASACIVGKPFDFYIDMDK
jgi:hypothetical protein